MHVTAWAYVALGAALAACLATDFVLLRRPGAGSLRSAAIATVAWTAIGLAATGAVVGFDGGRAGADYVTIYLLERALSLDNVAVFAIVLAALRVPAARREGLVVLGVAIALLLRVALIGGGLALVDALHATLYFFGALLLLTGLNTIRSGLPAAEEEAGEHGEGGLMVRLAARLGARSSLYGPVLALALADVVFAVDSIPAAFGISRDVFPIIAANGFSVLGLHAAYVLLQGGMARFRHLDSGLGVVLVLIGLELVTEGFVTVPAWATLLGVVVVLGLAIAASLRDDGPDPAPARPADNSPAR